jgi:transposase
MARCLLVSNDLFWRGRRKLPMATQPSFSIDLDLPDIRIISTRLAHEQDLIIEAESESTSVNCDQCRRPISEFDGYAAPRKLRYLTRTGAPLTILFRPKRFRCPYCDGHPMTIQQLQIQQPLARAVGGSEDLGRST